MRALPDRILQPASAFRALFANPSLRRLQLAWAGSALGGWTYFVAIAVFAFQAGGASAVGLATLIRFVPAAVAAPFTSLLGDRLPRRSVMLGADLTRVGLLSGMAVSSFLGGPAGVVYALAACSAVASTAFGPAQAALLPSLARTPEELTAANVVSSTIESVGIFAGPALGGLILAVADPGAAFMVTAGTFAWSAALVARLPHGSPPEAERRGGLGHELLAGFSTIGLDRRVRVFVGLFATQTLVDGALGVMIVVLAFDRLGLGASGVGLLNAVVGIGGIAGAVVAAALAGRRRLAGDFGLGILLWGLPIALIGIWPSEAAALILLAVVGVGNTLVDVMGFTLLQRTVPDEVLARVFGVLRSVILVTAGIGAVLAPVAISALGLRGALVAVGLILPVLSLLLWPRLRAFDALAVIAEDELGLLRGVPFFAPLPEFALEQLARGAIRVRVHPGAEIVRRGESGDRFYVIAAGEVEVDVGRGSPTVQGPGDFFGEIALLRDVPRTATVRARGEADLLAVERDDFIGAVTGYAPSAEAAEAVVTARIGGTSAVLSEL
ncbi:MAG TPA: MFS transporter [Gaiellaceae bacterium]|nr:MFS transporter [Gaiellaceae bacterium]